MAQRSGRINCPRCQSNNFDTVTVCWKCGASLVTGAPPQPAMPSPQSSYSTVAPPSGYAQSSGNDRFAGMQAMAATAIAASGNPAAANRAAFWLGLLMPYFGLPIGLAFVMCDDRRRQEVGRICILWSTISGVIHLLFTIVGLLGMQKWLMFALGVAKSQLGRPGGMGGGLGGGGLGGGFD